MIFDLEMISFLLKYSCIILYKLKVYKIVIQKF